jgi:hypothetical protein
LVWLVVVSQVLILPLPFTSPWRVLCMMWLAAKLTMALMVATIVLLAKNVLDHLPNCPLKKRYESTHCACLEPWCVRFPGG